MTFDNIPRELKEINQWINWRSVEIDGKQTKQPLNSRTGRLASVTDPRDWGDFATAVLSASQSSGIGFVFTRGDPFCGLDVDSPGNDAILQGRANSILASFNSYTEVSPSGNGLHIIVRATLPGGGRKRNKIEIYDDKRFFTFTGNVFRDAPIAECPHIIDLWHTLGGSVDTIETPAQSETQHATDEHICELATRAENGDKFRALFAGNWESLYKSQSEADFALINILAFYSRNTAQIKRLFLASGLGKREKAKRGPYLGGMIRRSFDRMPPTLTLAPGEPWFDAAKIEPWAKTPPERLLGPLEPPAFVILPAVAPPGVSIAPPAALPAIPGLVGRLAAHCWHLSAYPVPEVAIASALASMSVLCGRSYRFGNRGLSLYLLLLAKTSIGKSFAYQAQHAWQNALIAGYSDPTSGHRYKQRREFLENMITGKIASGQGLAQHMLANPATLAQLDEFTTMVKRLASPYASGNEIGIKEELLSLVDASHPGAIYREKRYSDRSKKGLVTVQSACLTILGTGTPEGFYDDLSGEILQGGFIPRFTLLDYAGTLPQRNDNTFSTLDNGLLTEIHNLFNKLFELSQGISGDISQIQNVNIESNAQVLLKEYERNCEDNVRFAHMQNLPTAGVWSRASLHITQIAALIAIGVNWINPVITIEHVELSNQIVQPGLLKLTGKVASGEAGYGDTRLEAEIKHVFKRVQNEGYEFLRGSNALSEQAMSAGLMQVAALKWYCLKRAPFNNHKMGGIRAFNDVFNDMCKSGTLELVDVPIYNGRKMRCVRQLYM